MKALSSLALSALLGLLVLGLLEVGLRIFTGANSQWNIRIGASKRFDPVTQFRNKSLHAVREGVVTNELGYLAPMDLKLEKPDGELRMIYLGDSVTFMPPGRNYPTWIEERIERDHGIPVQTINTAVPGFASDNGRKLFESEVSAYDADFLFVYFGWNDLGQYGPEGLPYKRRVGGYELSPLQRALSNVYSIRLLYALLRYQQKYQTAVDEPLTAEEQALYESYDPSHFDENLRAILRIGKARYPRFYVMNLASITSEDPLPEEMTRAHFPIGMGKNIRKLHRLVRSYNETVERVARGEGVPMIDLSRAFASHEAKRELTDSCHVTEAGANLIADAVLAQITPEIRALQQAGYQTASGAAPR